MDSKWYLQLPLLPSNIVVECNYGDKAVLRCNTIKDAILDIAILDVAILDSSR